MAGRIRTIKPELLEDENAANLSHVAWRLWVSSFILADDYGNFRANPAWLSGQVFWGDSRESRESVERALRELATCKGGSGMIQLYELHGQQYAHITGWHHQRVDKPGKPRCPGPDDPDSNMLDGFSARVSGESRESLGNIPGTLVPDLLPPTSDLLPPTPTSDQRPPTTTAKQKNESRESRERPEPTKPTNGVAAIWNHWLERRPATRRRTLEANTPEYRLIKKRLAAYPAEDICRAIDGMFLDKWSVEHDKLDIGWALRQDEKHNNLDKFIELASQPQAPTPKRLDEHGQPMPVRECDKPLN